MKNLKKIKEYIVEINLDKETTYEEFEISAKLITIINKELELWEKKEERIWSDTLKD